MNLLIFQSQFFWMWRTSKGQEDKDANFSVCTATETLSGNFLYDLDPRLNWLDFGC